MKKIIALIAALTFVGSVSAMAAGPESITLNAKNGNVTFAHKKHQELLKNECKTCHEKGPGKIEGFNKDPINKDAAHKLCKGCHEEKKAGPTKCGECHKK